MADNSAYTLNPVNTTGPDAETTLLGLLQRIGSLQNEPLVPANPAAQAGTILSGFASGFQGRPNPSLELFQQQRQQQLTGLHHQAGIAGQLATLSQRRQAREDAAKKMNLELYNSLKTDPDLGVRETAYRFGQQAGILPTGIDPKVAALKGGKEFETRHDQVIALTLAGHDIRDPKWVALYPPELYGPVADAARDAMLKGGGPMAANSLRLKPESAENVMKAEALRLNNLPDRTLTDEQRRDRDAYNLILKLKPDGQAAAERYAAILRREDAEAGLPLKLDSEYLGRAYKLMHTDQSTLTFISQEADRQRLTGATRYKFISDELGKIAGTRALNVYNAALDVPMDPRAAANLRHPATLTMPRPGMTKRDALMSGYVDVDDKQLDALKDIDSTKNIVATLHGLADKLITAKTGPEAAAQWAWLNSGARATKLYSTIKTYEDEKEAFLGNLSRQAAAERGVLTNQDISRLSRSLPGFADTVMSKETKKAIMSSILGFQREATLARIFGRPFDEKTARAAVDQLLSQLEGTTPKPVKPAAPPKGSPDERARRKFLRGGE